MNRNLLGLLPFFFFIFSPISLIACHLVSIVETAATDNGDGTYTYTFDVCVGTEDTYGFYLSFTGANLISYPASVTGLSLGNTIFASDPPISGTGDIEYGDWDNSTGLLFSGVNNDCVSMTFTFDDPISLASLGGTQIIFLPPLGCAEVSTPATTCFSPTLTVNITTDDYGGETTWSIIDQVTLLTIASGGPYADNTSYSIPVCAPSACYDFVIFDSFGDGMCCTFGLGSYSVVDNMATVVASGGSFGFSELTSLPCIVLGIELANFELQGLTGHNRIKWKVSSQLNNDLFVIERSENLQNWVTVETLQGAGTTDEEIAYEIRDEEFRNVINYYRLTQVDYDGSTTVFSPKSLDNRINTAKMIGRTNYLGQEVDASYSGLVIEYYSDGSIKRNYQQ